MPSSKFHRRCGKNSTKVLLRQGRRWLCSPVFFVSKNQPAGFLEAEKLAKGGRFFSKKKKHFLGTQPQDGISTDLNIGETRVWRLDSGPNLQP